jgi:hypothetical protein
MRSTTTSSTPSAGELFDGLSFFPIALVVSATIFPGMAICIPGLIFAAAFILIPLAAIALVLVVVAAVVASPFLAVRGIRELARRHADAKSQSPVTVDDVAPATFVPSASVGG